MTTELSRRGFLKIVGAAAGAMFIPTDWEPPYEWGTVIDGVMTYGDQRPLDDLFLRGLVRQLNWESKQGQRPSATENFYLSLIMTENAYRQFKGYNNGESYQTFAKRHVEAINKTFYGPNADLQSVGYPTRLGRIILRELIIIKKGIPYPQTYFLDNSNYKIAGTDGVYAHTDLYNPQTSGYYDSHEKIDWGWAHEVGHAAIHLPDQYFLDLDMRKLFSPVLIDVPAPWRAYFIGNRRDPLGQTLMIAGFKTPNLYDALMVARRIRQGWNHDQDRIIRDFGLNSFSPEVPLQTLLRVGPSFKQHQVEVYRTRRVEPPNLTFNFNRKTLDPCPVFKGSFDDRGTVNIDNPFKGAVNEDLAGEPLWHRRILPTEGTLFIKATGPDGKLSGLRWMDIREFNVASWLGFTGQATFSLGFNSPGLASPQISPEEFNWYISYSGSGVSRKRFR